MFMVVDVVERTPQRFSIIAQRAERGIAWSTQDTPHRTGVVIMIDSTPGLLP
jgi:hypothetical protein